ncbi:MAG: GspH/FimT family pseudopilin, partial [Candidatus Eremiobacterota bacterium]
MRRRGFSLVEMLLVLLLVALLATLGLVSGGGSRERGGTMAAAEALAGELRAARQRAISEQTPVAVCLPSENGSKPHTQALYVLAGESLPRVGRVVDLSREVPGTYLAAGFYPLSGGLSWSRTPLAAVRPFDATAWALPFPADPLLLFTPSGQVQSNLPHVDGEFRLLACSGLSWTPGSVAGGSSFQLDNLYHPVTVLVTQSGQVRVDSGAADASGVTVRMGRAQPAAPPALPPPLASGPNADPVVLGPASVAPVPIPGTLPAGVDATVALGRHLSLRIEAVDPDGDPLYCQWIVQENPGGAFASGAATRMTWDRAANGGAGAWVSTWQWGPPPGAGAG